MQTVLFCHRTWFSCSAVLKNIMIPQKFRDGRILNYSRIPDTDTQRVISGLKPNWDCITLVLQTANRSSNCQLNSHSCRRQQRFEVKDNSCHCSMISRRQNALLSPALTDCANHAAPYFILFLFLFVKCPCSSSSSSSSRCIADNDYTIVPLILLDKKLDQLMMTNPATRLEVSQGHQTWYHSIS